ncbi:MAG TPA: iron-containing alcohol dehydrogenase [Verrucomicrobiota bacterium]|nr:iron-containing alcohol dehydrogenase [Verrucomicrobiota bacterium]
MTPAGEAAAGFEFATATRIVFGAGTVAQAGRLAQELGRRPLVVTGANPDRARPLLEALAAEKLGHEVFPVPGEPTTLHVAAGVARAELRACDCVIGFGGGAAMDAAKAIAGLLTNGGDLYDYLEVVGRGRPLCRAAAPWMAIPTTAGAGAEVTRNAVLLSREHRVKASLRSPLLLARVALVDPRLSLSLPPAATAATGLDALPQLIEPFTGTRANPLTDALCRDGLGLVGRSLRRAFHHGHDLAARADMALAALFGGLALANAGLGAVHGFAAPLGGSFPAPHGAVCAALLAPVMAANLAALRARAPESGVPARYAETARRLTGHADATAEDGVAWVRALTAELGIPPLRTYGLREDDLAALVEKAQAASSMKANPIALTAGELAGVLRDAL